jgi:hypothetical protein
MDSIPEWENYRHGHTQITNLTSFIKSEPSLTINNY